MTESLLAFSGLTSIIALVGPLWLLTWRVEYGVPITEYGLLRVHMYGCPDSGLSPSALICFFLRDGPTADRPLSWDEYHRAVCTEAVGKYCLVDHIVDLLSDPDDDDYCSRMMRRCPHVMELGTYNVICFWLFLASALSIASSVIGAAVKNVDWARGLAAFGFVLSLSAILIYTVLCGESHDQVEETQNSLGFLSSNLQMEPVLGLAFYVASAGCVCSAIHAALAVVCLESPKKKKKKNGKESSSSSGSGDDDSSSDSSDDSGSKKKKKKADKALYDAQMQPPPPPLMGGYPAQQQQWQESQWQQPQNQEQWGQAPPAINFGGPPPPPPPVQPMGPMDFNAPTAPMGATNSGLPPPP
eukprot:TRINITY_DN54250_c0_g1_i1.p1 TRINITY_DN54250_c0_g1~~TRINITY_DN54250_c0_g1_i1.p1  ORF type:complete len:357 (+),score=49.49 TRINITY_DN54250_c0_g1_i1:60-1130(+)